ncbi:expressed unknown protein [Seminavis robusta]|uniref:Uncharacterized protein n=1 Tax=Seminavis robusta TaxID=568900 RepID=A0A9N8H9L6_9STRA|nr:expressed unknown protein [Seminavis robusta]|eukprot:Sro281_g107250.1 n/a (208) ;mRNA; f:28966-29589
MTTTAASPTDTPLSDYFSNMDSPLGGDPFAAWDADLHPSEYGDQSGFCASHASFSDDDDDDDDAHSLSSHEDDDDDDWNIVYAASFTVVASAQNGGCCSTTTTKRRSSLTAMTSSTTSSTTLSSSTSTDCMPAAMTRRDSKVRFSEQPPQVNCYETCSRDQHSDLWFSVHELQKNICELRLESNNNNNNNSSSKPLATTAPTRSRSA